MSTAAVLSTLAEFGEWQPGNPLLRAHRAGALRLVPVQRREWIKVGELDASTCPVVAMIAAHGGHPGAWPALAALAPWARLAMVYAVNPTPEHFGQVVRAAMDLARLVIVCSSAPRAPLWADAMLPLPSMLFVPPLDGSAPAWGNSAEVAQQHAAAVAAAGFTA